MTDEYVRPLAIVTGAASGMGRAAALKFADRYDLILCDLHEAGLGAIADGAEICGGDLAAPETIERLMTAIGDRRVSAFVHAAGVSPSMAPPADIVRINLIASMALCDAIGPRMAVGGAAVLLASMGAYMLPDASLLPLIEAVLDASPEERADAGDALATATAEGNTAYGATKRGIVMLVRKRAVEWGRRGARIASVSPGMIETPMGRKELGAAPDLQQYVDSSAIGRFGHAEEIASVIDFFCSNSASFITGIDLIVDGGVLASLGLPA